MEILATVSLNCSQQDLFVEINSCIENNINCIRINLDKIRENNYEDYREKCNIVKNHRKHIKIAFDIPYPNKKPRLFFSDSPMQIYNGQLLKFYNVVGSDYYIDVKEIHNHFREGESYLVENGRATFRVKRINKTSIEFESDSNFILRSGKSISFDGLIKTEFEKNIKEMINYIKPEEIWFSFVEESIDERELLLQLDYTPDFFYKIETQYGLNNIENIVSQGSGNIIVARGDLSVNVPHSILYAQKQLIDIAKKYKRKVYVSTNFLQSMSFLNLPSPSDMIDVQLALTMGCDGLVLNVSNVLNNFSKQIFYIRQCERSSYLSKNNINLQ